MTKNTRHKVRKLRPISMIVPPEGADDAWFARQEIEECLRTSAELLINFDFYHEDLAPSVYMAILTQLLIEISGATQVSNSRLNARCELSGKDIDPVGKEKDLTSLLLFMRNAACHSNSAARALFPGRPTNERGSFKFGMAAYRLKLISTDDQEIECPYDDDVAFYFGVNRIYLHRNLIVAHNWLAQTHGLKYELATKNAPRHA